MWKHSTLACVSSSRKPHRLGRAILCTVHMRGSLVQGSCWGFYTLITRKHFCVLFSVFLLIHFISCCLPSHISNSCSHNISPTVWEDTVGRSQYILCYTPGRTICLLLLDIFATDCLQQQRVWLLKADPLQWVSCKWLKVKRSKQQKPFCSS